MKLVRIVKEYSSTVTLSGVKPIPTDNEGRSKYLLALPDSRADILIKSGYAVECTEKDLVSDNRSDTSSESKEEDKETNSDVKPKGK